MAESETKQMLSLKLLVDTKGSKVLFAEAGKDFVDFFFHTIMDFSNVVKLLSQQDMVGCLEELYKSIEPLSTQFFHPDYNKDSMFNPKSAVNVPLLSLTEAPPTPDTTTTRKFYRCGSCPNVTDHPGALCPSCGGAMTLVLNYVWPTVSLDILPSSGGESGGYVKGVVAYMVMDNLEVKPMSTISGITLMNKFHVKDVSTLEEKD